MARAARPRSARRTTRSASAKTPWLPQDILEPAPALLVLGNVLFLMSVIVTLTKLENWKRRQRIIATPTSPIAPGAGNELILTNETEQQLLGLGGVVAGLVDARG